jgi:hypothetical protein
MFLDARLFTRRITEKHIKSRPFAQKHFGKGHRKMKRRQVFQIGQRFPDRVAIQVDGFGSTDVLEGEAVARLFDYYASAGKRSLRWTLQTLHSAHSASVAAGRNVITATLVDDAAAG